MEIMEAVQNEEQGHDQAKRTWCTSLFTGLGDEWCVSDDGRSGVNVYYDAKFSGKMYGEF